MIVQSVSFVLEIADFKQSSKKPDYISHFHIFTWSLNNNCVKSCRDTCIISFFFPLIWVLHIYHKNKLFGNFWQTSLHCMEIRLHTFSVIFIALFICTLILNMFSTGTMLMYSTVQKELRMAVPRVSLHYSRSRSPFGFCLVSSVSPLEQLFSCLLCP